jgi:zinc transport system substrate-binding protein
LVPKLRRSYPKLAVVDTRQGIKLQPMVAHDHDHDHGAKPQAKDSSKAPVNLDPHIWTSPPLVKQQAATVRDTLIALRPAEQARFEAGYARYAAELDALDAELRRLLAGKSGRRFMVFHPSWGYLASAYGLEQIPIEIEGKEPSPKALARIIDRAKAEGIRVIFVQPQFSRTAAEQVARAIGGEVVAIDPLAEDFVGNLRQVAQALARGLQ